MRNLSLRLDPCFAREGHMFVRDATEPLSISCGQRLRPVLTKCLIHHEQNGTTLATLSFTIFRPSHIHVRPGLKLDSA